jgi:hypothetical protein
VKDGERRHRHATVKRASPDRVPMKRCQRRIVLTWAVGVLPASAILMAQALWNTYGEKTVGVIEWFLPSVMPTLLLVIGVVANSELDDTKKQRPASVSVFFFRLTMGISVVYLLVLTAAVLISPLVPGVDARIATMHRSSLLLGPLQGLVSATLGVFFATSQRHEPTTAQVDQ